MNWIKDWSLDPSAQRTKLMAHTVIMWHLCNLVPYHDVRVGSTNWPILASLKRQMGLDYLFIADNVICIYDRDKMARKLSTDHLYYKYYDHLYHGMSFSPLAFLLGLNFFDYLSKVPKPFPPNRLPERIEKLEAGVEKDQAAGDGNVIQCLRCLHAWYSSYTGTPQDKVLLVQSAVTLLECISGVIVDCSYDPSTYDDSSTSTDMSPSLSCTSLTDY